MRRKFQMFLFLFLLLINCSWTYGVHTKDDQVDYKLYSGNAAEADSVLTIVDITNGPCSLYVSWTCSNCPSTFDGYNVTWQQTEEDNESASSLVSYRSSYYLIENLNCDQTYTVRVAAVINGEETFSDEKQKSTTKGEPVKVTGVTIGDVSDTIINVSWDETLNVCPVQVYHVIYNGTSKWDGNQFNMGYRETDKTTMELEDLRPYFVYDISVSEITTDGIIGEPSDPVTAETKEGAASPPEPVTSLAFDSYSAQVNWSFPESPNGVILGYCVKYQILPDEKVNCDEMVGDPDTFSITLTDLEACGDYTFSVLAINGYEDGFGEPGTDSSTTDPEPPPHFTNFGNENLTSTSVVLTWDPLDTTCPVTKYSIHIEEKVLWKENTTDSFDKTYSGEDNYYLLEGLIPYSQYDISIQATTEGGTTKVTDSDRQQIVTLEGEAGAPSFINSSTIDSHTVSLHWSPPENANGIINGYVICYKKKEDKVSVCPITTNEKTLQYDVEGLEACGDYSFSVQTQNGAGKGEKASTESQTDNEKPGEIGNVNIVAQNSTNMTIEFKAPDTSCEIRYDIEGVGTYQWSNESYDYKDTLVVTSDGEYIVPNLIPYTSYVFNMSATTAGGTTGGVMFEGETEKDVPSEPNNLKATALDSTQIKVTWDEPEYQNGNRLKSYYLTYELFGSESGSIEVINTKQYTIGAVGHENEKLLPCETYTIRVRASNEIGNGTAAYQKATLYPGVPYAVNELSCSTTGSESIDIFWEVHHSSCVIQYYEISLSGDILWDGTTSNTRNVSTHDTSLILSGLIPCTSYEITLTPATEAGLGEPTTCNCETDPDVPSAPTKLALWNITTSSFTVTWDDPEFENGFIYQYVIYLYRGYISILDSATVPYNESSSFYEYSFEDLDPRTPYEVTVAAENEVGIGRSADLQVITY